MLESVDADRRNSPPSSAGAAPPPLAAGAEQAPNRGGIPMRPIDRTRRGRRGAECKRKLRPMPEALRRPQSVIEARKRAQRCRHRRLRCAGHAADTRRGPASVGFWPARCGLPCASRVHQRNQGVFRRLSQAIMRLRPHKLG